MQNSLPLPAWSRDCAGTTPGSALAPQFPQNSFFLGGKRTGDIQMEYGQRAVRRRVDPLRRLIRGGL